MFKNLQKRNVVNINQGVPKRWYEESVHFSECTCGGSILTADERQE